MSYATEPVTLSLKAARERKGLSQRTLGAQAGVPQSHISRIEKGVVDLRLSSLVELARTLDLELMLVPRGKTAVVQAIIRDDDQRNIQSARGAAKILQHLENQIEALPGDVQSEIVIQKLQRWVRELMHFNLSADDLVQLQDVSAVMQEFQNDPCNLSAAGRAETRMSVLRNALADDVGASVMSGPRPAYRLDGDDHG
ncbi:MAG: helix-turn-helix transcriptional regulator [Rhodobacteraceae bacterium]|nr:helix-turn-helix transcriptional regulator [Paracoccaceae bacterium]